MIRVPHAAAYPIDFNLLCDRVQQGGVLKLMKNNRFLLFLVILAVWVFFPKFLGKLKSGLCSNCKKIRWVSHIVTCPIVFILFYERSWQGRVIKVMKNDDFFSVFSRLYSLAPVFGQVNGWFMLKPHKIIRVSHVLYLRARFFKFCFMS